ncbi:hypothetical protein B0T16DRAFT_410633 [Cercophora newfieldiana]|uniref:Uncharacterized protein n=1 Tax=Cercophora newfieldiana TaxID=92897 RepID=A0AA39YBT0_9PEZI|nr:hypothetical protein B0T16DRAFT_410633 [Cercophora newfieldiana]
MTSEQQLTRPHQDMETQDRNEPSSTSTTASAGAPIPTPAESQAPSISEHQPPYTPQQIGHMFRDLHEFLSKTLYFEATILDPPQGGFTFVQPNPAKSDLANEVIRRIPRMQYDKSYGTIHSHYKSNIYIDPKGNEFNKLLRGMVEDVGMDVRDAFFFSTGHDGHGSRWIIVHARHGVIQEEAEGRGREALCDMREWIEDLKGKYRSLKLIPFPGCETLECEDVPEWEGGEITLEEVCSQREAERWREGDGYTLVEKTAVDYGFIRQTFRRFGWPDAFEQVKCWEFFRETMVGDGSGEGLDYKYWSGSML